MFASFTTSIAHFVLLPPLSLFLAMLTGWLLQRRWPRLGRTVMYGASVALIVLCTDAGARLLVRPLESLTAPLAAYAAPGPESPPDTRPAQGAQAIVVLAAGSMERAPEYGADIPDTIALARIRYGAYLQHQTGLPLLVSGGNADPARKVEAKAHVMARVLRDDFRTPVQWVEPESATTAENAAFSARMLKQAGVRRVLLVTTAMHMARAQRAFEHAGLEVVPAPTMFQAYGPLSPLEFVPSADALQASYYASYEWIGLAWYRLNE
ncbi:YdcF family protein [Pseudoduganella sp. LjRoot289]|uniref:YdcF family protein n=1 Tax=Pseudoduganella sp. LjRoot289 TaxID=3342314 RepID=UPI003ECC45F6